LAVQPRTASPILVLIGGLQFPSAEAAEAFVNDPQYVPYAAARKGGSESRFQLIDDTESGGHNSLFAERMISQKFSAWNGERLKRCAA
jgi:hypothetical protein